MVKIKIVVACCGLRVTRCRRLFIGELILLRFKGRGWRPEAELQSVQASDLKLQSSNRWKRRSITSKKPPTRTPELATRNT